MRKKLIAVIVGLGLILSALVCVCVVLDKETKQPHEETNNMSGIGTTEGKENETPAQTTSVDVTKEDPTVTETTNTEETAASAATTEPQITEPSGTNTVETKPISTEPPQTESSETTPSETQTDETEPHETGHGTMLPDDEL